MTSASRERPWPKVSGAKPESGHYEEFIAHPARFLLRAWRECGELAEFDLGGAPHLLMSGPAAIARARGWPRSSGQSCASGSR